MAPLQKGKACVNCRRRKIKCDGAKPICGQCSKFSTAFGDCEYTESGPSHAEVLEDQIAILQARIEELEKPNKRHKSTSPTRPAPTRRHSAPTGQISPSNTMALGPLLSYFYLQQTSGSSLNQTAANSMPTELPFFVLQALVHNFLHNAYSFGFFLDTQAFHDAITSKTARDLPPVLLNVLYLWGVHLSKDTRITVYEPAFLAHALRSTAGSLAGSHPRTILHSMQASVLLAQYFFRNARFLEGKYHTSAAVSIAVSAGLQRMRAAPSEAGRSVLAGALPPPKDPGEEGERIGAFWNVLNLNNCWAGMDGTPSNVSYAPSGLRIDTPWPLTQRDYVEHPHLLPLRSNGTVTKFLADVPDDVNSGPALYAKAGILFEEGTRLGERCRTGSLAETETEFIALDDKIDAFKATLPPIQHKQMLVVHMLCHGATIQLHNALGKDRPVSRNKTLAAARAMADILLQTDVPKVGLLDPILAPLWTSACLVFIADIARQRGSSSLVDRLTGSLNVVIGAMEFFAPHCRLMTSQLEAVRQAYAAA